MNTHLIIYGLGATQIVLGASTVTTLQPAAYHSKWMFKKLSGGSYAVVEGTTYSVSQGYMIGETEVIQIQGPAKFFLACSGITTTIQVMVGYSQGKL